MKKQLWMINVRPVMDGKQSKRLTHIAFYDKVKGETHDQALVRVTKSDPIYRVMFLTRLAVLFGGADVSSYEVELAKNKKRAKNKRKSTDDILIDMIGIKNFKVYISSVDEAVHTVDLAFSDLKKKK